MHARRSRSQWAFTLIELMVVMAIIALLVVVLVVGFGGVGETAKVKKTGALILQVVGACERFRNAHGFYPPDAPGASGDPSWSPGDPPPWDDDERCIYVADAGVDSDQLYVGLLEYLGLGNPSDTVASGEALTFCLLLDKRGGPFTTVDQEQLANSDDDTYQPYLDEDNDGQRLIGGGEDLGSEKGLFEIVDAWGRPFRFRSPAGRNQGLLLQLRNPVAVEIYSAGSNGVFGEDDGEDNDGDGDTDEPGELDTDDIANWRGTSE